MSEYQYVAFRAVDAPLSEKNLQFMHKQSSRAEITPWSFDNEYHFGDFGGNAEEMLRRGYDIHLHYANFGIRTLMIRLPNGFPDLNAAKPYFDKEGMRFEKDKQGEGGILSIEPSYEPDRLDEVYEIDELFNRLVSLRAEILEGDLRPLYLAYLGVGRDSYIDPDEFREGPIPAGLGKITNAQAALAEFYGLSEHLIQAAARGAPSLTEKSDPKKQHDAWLENQSEAVKNAWLAQLIADPHSNVRGQVLAEFQKSHALPPWPIANLNRTLTELEGSADEIANEAKHKEDEKAARLRTKKLADLAADPTKALRETEQMLATLGSKSYKQIAFLLDNLREALANTPQTGLAEQQALKLKTENPTLRKLHSVLREHGLVPK